MTALETEGQVCLWCTAALPAGRGRGSERRFCGPSCRRAHEKASRRLGKTVAEVDFSTPGSLRSWSGKARALHEGVKSDDLVSDTVKDAFTRPERPEAAPYSFVQFGHNWFVTDQDGHHVGSPLKTAVQAQRLARRMTEASLRGTDRR